MLAAGLAVQALETRLGTAVRTFTGPSVNASRTTEHRAWTRGTRLCQSCFENPAKFPHNTRARARPSNPTGKAVGEERERERQRRRQRQRQRDRDRETETKRRTERERERRTDRETQTDGERPQRERERNEDGSGLVLVAVQHRLEHHGDRARVRCGSGVVDVTKQAAAHSRHKHSEDLEGGGVDSGARTSSAGACRRRTARGMRPWIPPRTARARAAGGRGGGGVRRREGG